MAPQSLFSFRYHAPATHPCSRMLPPVSSQAISSTHPTSSLAVNASTFASHRHAPVSSHPPPTTPTARSHTSRSLNAIPSAAARAPATTGWSSSAQRGASTSPAGPAKASPCELIPPSESAPRHAAYKACGIPNYILTLNEIPHPGSGSGSGSTPMQTTIDPTRSGNVARFANHSCDPNMLVVPVRVGSMRPHVCLFAARDIPPHEELTFSYGAHAGPAGDLVPCLCGAVRCTGFLPFSP
ncbi:histone-lysine N-methyltransferase [Synchytrium endobioticum]|uniref:Histone-lysine N-methyltransferase n=1 Tax=Synchytrium endobioticum TaxID=286115 RepID=A0A507D8B1_9FUNG|nr:histone-lysine N-methyltransferase [Synchytrium endobioticum]